MDSGSSWVVCPPYETGSGNVSNTAHGTPVHTAPRPGPETPEEGAASAGPSPGTDRAGYQPSSSTSARTEA